MGSDRHTLAPRNMTSGVNIIKISKEVMNTDRGFMNGRTSENMYMMSIDPTSQVRTW